MFAFDLGNTDAKTKSNNGDVLRYPIVEGDYSNVGYCYKEVVKALPPNAKALYVYPCTSAQISTNRLQGNNLQRFQNAVVGINTIGKLIKELCVSAGMEDSNKKTPHMMRRFVCTTLANDPNVNENEVARTLRHKSTASQKAYISMNERSEMARTKAVLGASVVDSMIEKAANSDDDERKLTPEEMQALQEQGKPAAVAARSDQSFTLPDPYSSSSSSSDDDSSSSSDSDSSAGGVPMMPVASSAAAVAPKKKKKHHHNNQQHMMPFYPPYNPYGMMPGYQMPPPMPFGYGIPPNMHAMAHQMPPQAPPMPHSMPMGHHPNYYGYSLPHSVDKSKKKRKKTEKKSS